MALYDERVIDRVQQATDIAAIIQDYVPLKRSGRNLKACCPFHKEKTPSFIVTPDRQTFHCFGCGVGGDVFEFLIKMESMVFPEAVRHLAELAHIELPAASASRDPESAPRREKMLDLYAMAGRFFSAHYHSESHGQMARQYMERRRFGDKILDEFQVGFSPAHPRALFDAFKKKGVKEEDILASGLVSRTQQGNIVDLFRGRVIFPIWNAQGKIIGFGGRVMGDDLPKYINSPESDLFKKRRELFGLHLAKRHIDRDDPYMIVVEGYLDAIRLHEAGIRNVVATLGTSLTEEHARLLKRYVREIVLVFDGDQAGESASLRGLDIFLEEGMSVKLIGLPTGKDPDDFVRDQGGDAFRELLAHSEDMFTFKLKLLLKRHNPKEAKGLVAIASEMAITLSKVPNAVLLDRYTRQLSSVLGVDPQAIQLELAKVRDKLSPHLRAAVTAPENPSRPLSQDPLHAEYAVISLMAEDESLARRAVDLISAKDFRGRETSEIFARIAVEIAEGRDVSARVVLRWNLSTAFKSLLSAHPYSGLLDEERQKALRHCISRMKKTALEGELNELRAKIRQAENNGDQTRVTDLVRQFQERSKTHSPIS